MPSPAARVRESLARSRAAGRSWSDAWARVEDERLVTGLMDGHFPDGRDSEGQHFPEWFHDLFRAAFERQPSSAAQRPTRLNPYDDAREAVRRPQDAPQAPVVASDVARCRSKDDCNRPATHGRLWVVTGTRTVRGRNFFTDDKGDLRATEERVKPVRGYRLLGSRIVFTADTEADALRQLAAWETAELADRGQATGVRQLPMWCQTHGDELARIARILAAYDAQPETQSDANSRVFAPRAPAEGGFEVVATIEGFDVVDARGRTVAHKDTRDKAASWARFMNKHKRNPGVAIRGKVID